MKGVVFIEPLGHRQIQPKLRFQLFFEPGYVPLLLHTHRRDKAVNGVIHYVLANRSDGFSDFIIGQQFVPLTINNLTLVIGHIIVFKQLLADVKVASFDFSLRFFDGVGHHTVLNGFTPLHPEGLHKALDPIGGKNAHQVVFERQIETRNPGVTLPSGAPTQLIVDTTGFMPLGPENMETAGLDNRIMTHLPISGESLAGCLVQRVTLRRQLRLQVAAKYDVSTAARHVGGDGDHAGASSLGDNFRLLLVVLGVQHFVIDLLLFKRLGELFGRLNRRGAHQNGRATVSTGAHILDYGFKLFFPGKIHQIIRVIPTHRHIGRDHHAVQTIDLAEFKGLGIGGPGHSGQLVVDAKEVLKGGRGQGLALTLDLYPFLGLNGLMQAF